MAAVNIPVDRPTGWEPVDILNTWIVGDDRAVLLWAAAWYVAREAGQIVDLIDEAWPPRAPYNVTGTGDHFGPHRLTYGKRKVDWSENSALNVTHADSGLLVVATYPAELWAVAQQIDPATVVQLRAAAVQLADADAAYTFVKHRGGGVTETGRDELDEASDLVIDTAMDAWLSIKPGRPDTRSAAARSRIAQRASETPTAGRKSAPAVATDEPTDLLGVLAAMGGYA